MPENKKNIFFNIAFALLFTLVAVPAHFKAYPVLLFFIVLFLNKPETFNFRFFLLTSLLYWGLLLSLSYSANQAYGRSFAFETQALLLAFSLLFSFLSPRQFPDVILQKEKFFLVYIILVFLYSLSPAYWLFPPYNYGFKQLLFHYPGIINSHDYGLFSIHPIYMAVAVAWAFILSVYLIYKTSNDKLKIILALINAYFLFILYLLAKMGALSALFVGILLFIYFYKRQWFSAAVAIIIIGIFALFIVPNTRKRIQEIINIEKPEVLKKSSSGKRLRIFYSSWKSFKKAPFFGYGLGSHKDALLEQFRQDKEDDLLKRKLATHNQYMSFLLIGGIFLLIIYLIMIGISARLAWQHNNYLMLIFLAFFSVILFFENYLEREDGVVIFALFFNYLNWLTFYEQKK